VSTHALVGAVGGAGTTRSCLELAAGLARAGREVAVLDAAYATQGLGDYVPGRIGTDVTALCTDDRPLEAGLYDLETPAGRLAVCPARAPFERTARAKSPEAARRFEELLAEAGRTFDHALVDTPPVAANQAVAAVTAAERVTVVAPVGPRGDDGLARAHDRLADLDADPAATLRTRTETPGEADAALPAADETDPAAVPTGATGGDGFAAAAAAAVESLFGVEVPVDTEEEGGFGGLGDLR
jgi:cellulose biosynthesis protein BcsQ